MSPAPVCQPGLAVLRDRVRRDLEREQRRLEWIERGPPARKALARRTRVLIAIYQQLERELAKLPGDDETSFTAWLEHTARVGGVMKTRRVWPWWVYTRMSELAAPTTGSPAGQKISARVHQSMGTQDKRGAG